MINTKEIIDEISLLPVEERANIVDSLLKTLNPIEQDVEKEWIKVAEKRLDDIKSGKIKTINGDAVFKKILERYNK
jgi:putative addiction module component (TIGR02574 family)